jgi:hypothetical protein
LLGDEEMDEEALLNQIMGKQSYAQKIAQLEEQVKNEKAMAMTFNQAGDK